MKKATIARVFSIAASIAFCIGASPIASAAPHSGCSLLSLKGTYSDRDTGYLTAPPSVAGPFAGVNLDSFNGNGIMTGSGIASINGNAVPLTFSGTYTVNPDCTGTYTIQNSLGLTVHASFVITDDGNQLDIVITDPGSVLSCVARRQVSEGKFER